MLFLTLMLAAQNAWLSALLHRQTQRLNITLWKSSEDEVRLPST